MDKSPRPFPDIINAVARFHKDTGDTMVFVESMSHSDVAVHNGSKYDVINQFSVSIANPLYVLFENPIDSGVEIELLKRLYQADGGGAKLAILWDYDVSTAEKTPLSVFNSNNKYRLTKPANFDVSLLNPSSLDLDSGVFDITGGAVIADSGIIREPSSIPSTGTGSNKSGGINQDTGSRIYMPGTGYIVRITSETDNNLITLGYSIQENEI